MRVLNLRRLGVMLCAIALATLAGSVSGVSAQDGRWKLGGADECYFDPNDSGPDQCDPTPGRWKSDGSGGCYFDEFDGGPDQCSPAAVSDAPQETVS
jgi:hypothetical protein